MECLFLAELDAAKAITDAALGAESLTDRGIWIGLLIILIVLLVWYARTQAVKEARLIEQLEAIADKSQDVIQENTKAIEANRAALDNLTYQLREERGRRRGGTP